MTCEKGKKKVRNRPGKVANKRFKQSWPRSGFPANQQWRNWGDTPSTSWRVVFGDGATELLNPGQFFPSLNCFRVLEILHRRARRSSRGINRWESFEYSIWRPKFIESTIILARYLRRRTDTCAPQNPSLSPTPTELALPPTNTGTDPLFNTDLASFCARF